MQLAAEGGRFDEQGDPFLRQPVGQTDRGIDRLPALAVSFLSFASPIVATLLGYLFLNETLTFLQMVGALTIIGAVVLAQPRAKKTPAAETPEPALAARD